MKQNLILGHHIRVYLLLRIWVTFDMIIKHSKYRSEICAHIFFVGILSMETIEYFRFKPFMTNNVVIYVYIMCTKVAFQKLSWLDIV